MYLHRPNPILGGLIFLHFWKFPPSFCDASVSKSCGDILLYPFWIQHNHKQATCHSRQAPCGLGVFFISSRKGFWAPPYLRLAYAHWLGSHTHLVWWDAQVDITHPIERLCDVISPRVFFSVHAHSRLGYYIWFIVGASCPYINPGPTQAQWECRNQNLSHSLGQGE